MIQYILEKFTLNIRFTGDYEFLKWVLKKYKNQLPYEGEILKFANKTFYSKNISYSWSRLGVQVRAWNQLNKDLIIASLIGIIEEPKTLHELKEEFESGNNYSNSTSWILTHLQLITFLAEPLGSLG